jgi:site-specific recombinase XerD
MNGRDLSPRDAMERWLDRRRAEVSDQSLSTLHYRLKLFVDWCEERGVESMSAVDGWTIDEYQHHRHQHAKVVTLNKEFGTLKQFLAYCHTIGLVDERVPDAVKRPALSQHQKTDDTMLAADAAAALLAHYRETPTERATRGHALLEVLWHVGCRVGGVHSLDIRDFDADERWLRFTHRPATGTTLKNGRDGERYVGLLAEPAAVVAEYVREGRADITDDHGRQPLFPSRQGRPIKGTIRSWTGLATVPCNYRDCPHGHDPATCEWLSHSRVSQCPSSRAPHHVRTGSITWQRSQGVPVEVVATRVNASVDTIETYYDKEDPRAELEARRRGHLDNLELDNSND